MGGAQGTSTQKELYLAIMGHTFNPKHLGGRAVRSLASSKPAWQPVLYSETLSLPTPPQKNLFWNVKIQYIISKIHTGSKYNEDKF